MQTSPGSKYFLICWERNFLEKVLSEKKHQIPFGHLANILILCRGGYILIVEIPMTSYSLSSCH